MLEMIFGALSDALYVIADTLIALFGDFLDLSMDRFLELFPILGASYSVFQGLAIGLILLITIFSLAKFFVGPATISRESPAITLARAGIAVILVFFGGHVVTMLVNLFKQPFDAFIALGDGTTRNWGDRLATGFSGVLNTAAETILTGGVGLLADLIFSIILLVMFAKGFFQVIMEIFERYILMAILAFITPLPCATVASESTSDVFGRYCRMFFGQLLLMGLSIWSFNFCVSIFVSVGESGMGRSELLTRLMLGLASFKVAQRFDTFMQQLGVGVGTTGGNLGGELMGSAMAIGHGLSRMLGNEGDRAGGHSKEAVLGGVRDGSGNVQPDRLDGGILGAVKNAGRYAKDAYQRGESTSDIKNAAVRGAQDGFGAERLKNAVTGTKATQARAAARSAVTSETAGGATMSADKKTAHLDSTAESLGLKKDRNGAVTGNTKTVGQFMAANMGKNAAQSLVNQTAKHGKPDASEQALFGTHNNLKHTAESDVAKGEYDQTGSNMMGAALGQSFDDLSNKPDLTQDESNVHAVGAAIESTLNGENDNGKLVDFDAHDYGDNPDGGREVTASLQDQDGNLIGTMTTVDQKAFNALSEEQKEGFVAMTGATGAKYYMRASGLSPDGSKSYYGATSTIGSVTIPAENKPQAATGAAGTQVATATASGGPQTKASASGARSGATVHSGGSHGNVPNQTGEAKASGRIDVPSGSPVHQPIAGGPLEMQDGWDDVYIASDANGIEYMTCEDSLNGAAALQRTITSGKFADQDLATQTLDHIANENDAGAAQRLLFDGDVGGVPTGHDQHVAKALDSAVGAGAISSAVGAVSGDSGVPVIPEVEAQHLSGSLLAAAGRGATVEGYSCENIVSDNGVVGFTYNTPTGSYQVEMAETEVFERNASSNDNAVMPQTQFAASGVDYSASVQRIASANEPAVEQFDPTPQAPIMSSPVNVAAPTQPQIPIEPIAPSSTSGAVPTIPSAPPSAHVEQVAIPEPSDDDGRYGGSGKKNRKASASKSKPKKKKKR